MMNHDEMFDYVLTKYEQRLAQKQHRKQLARQTTLAGLCLTVIVGVGMQRHLGQIETAPESPPATETITETTLSTTVQQTTHLIPSTESAALVRNPIVPTSAITTVTAQTTHTTQTQTVATTADETVASALQTETTATVPVAEPTNDCNPSKITTFITTQVAESMTTVCTVETSTKPSFPRNSFNSGEDPIIFEDTTKPALPELPGFEITWDNSRWNVRCLESVSPSPDSNVLYTVSSDHYTVKGGTVMPEPKNIAGMYVIQPPESGVEISVMQYQRESFSFTCVPLREPESGVIGDIPCLWGKESDCIVLYWDDGYYTFRMWTDSGEPELLRELAECMKPSEALMEST